MVALILVVKVNFFPLESEDEFPSESLINHQRATLLLFSFVEMNILVFESLN